jgi:hypothetical protein
MEYEKWGSDTSYYCSKEYDEEGYEVLHDSILYSVAVTESDS